MADPAQNAPADVSLFDTAKARADGVSDRAIADFLSPMAGFDLAAARKDGVDDRAIVNFLAPPKAAPTVPRPTRQEPEDEVAPPKESRGAWGSDIKAGFHGTSQAMASTVAVRASQEIEDLKKRIEMFKQGDPALPDQLRHLAPQRQRQVPLLEKKLAEAEKRYAAALAEGAQDAKALQALPDNEPLQRFTGGELGEVLKNPGAVARGLIGQSLTAMVPLIVGTALGGVAGGATAGGAIGVATGGGQEAVRILAEKKIDATDPEAVKKALADPEIKAEIDRAFGIGQAIEGTVGAATGALGGVTVPAKTMPGAAVKNVSLQALGQGGLSGTGEAAKQSIIEGELHPGKIAAAALGEALFAPADAAAAAHHTRRVQQRAKADAAKIMGARSVDEAIEVAQEIVEAPAAIEGTPVDVEAIAGQARDFGGVSEQQQARLLQLGQTLGTVERAADGTHHYRVQRGETEYTMPLKVWDETTVPEVGQSPDTYGQNATISPTLAAAQREHYAKLGFDLVYVDDGGAQRVPFDGAVDPQNPNTIFLSNNPERNASLVWAHELTHGLEGTILPDKTTLASQFHALLEEGQTLEGQRHAYETFGKTAPDRSAFPDGPAGDAAHIAAVRGHLTTEFGADVGGEARKFQTYIPKVVAAVEARYGIDAARKVVQDLIASIRQSMETMRKFFFRADEGAEYGQPDTVSQRWLTNHEAVLDVLAKMEANQRATQAERENTALAEMRDRAQRDRFLKDEAIARPEEQPPTAPVGFFGEPTQDTTATGAEPPRVQQEPTSITPAAQQPAVAEITGRIATLRRWLGELDAKRREDAPNSPQATLLKQTEAAILRKVNGVEARLTNVARERLAKVRQDLDALVNPDGDSPDMTKVRAAMAVERQRLADAAAVGAPMKPVRATEETAQVAPGDPARGGKTGPALFSPKQTEALFSPRQFGIPREATAITTFKSAEDIKAHPDYREAKAGNPASAARLVSDLVKPEQIERARQAFAPDTLFVPVRAEEATGHNAIPATLAHFYAEATDGDVAPDLRQANRAFHTGANAMQRMVSRPEFAGHVEAGRHYVLVDDVSVLGGTLAELANHIQAGGGHVVGIVTLANAGRSGDYKPLRSHVSLIERRFGDEIKNRFGIEPSSLTADEAHYLANFRNVDELRARATAAEVERDRSLREKGLLPSEEEAGGVRPADEPEDKGPAFSPKLYGEGREAADYTPEERASLARIGAAEEHTTLREKLANARKAGIGTALIKAVVDPYAGLRALSSTAYVIARNANDVSGAVKWFMEGGTLKIAGSTYDVKDRTGGVVWDVIAPLSNRETGKTEAIRFIRWMIANRAEGLMAEGRENLFTAEDIATLKGLIRGTLDFDYTLANGKTTRSREAAFLDTQKKYNEYNRNVLDLARDNGWISAEAHKKFIDNPFYVPMFRVADTDGRISFPSSGDALARQTAFQKLKGGSEKLNADLWSNAIENWTHMIAGALKNKAGREILEVAEKTGAARKVSAKEHDHEMTKAQKESTTWIMVDGEKQYYQVTDKGVFSALQGLHAADIGGKPMEFLQGFRRIYQYGVTSNPWFAVQTLAKDLVHTPAVTKLSLNVAGNFKSGVSGLDVAVPFKNLARAVFFNQGIKAPEWTAEEGRLMAGGGLMSRTTFNESGVHGTRLSLFLNTPEKLRKVVGWINSIDAAHRQVQAVGEGISRMALYKKLTAEGVPHDIAAFEARDIQDYSLRPGNPYVRAYINLLPFANVHNIGLYKMARGSKDADMAIAGDLAKGMAKAIAWGATKKLAMVMAGLTALVVANDAFYQDDPDYQKRSELDRNTNFWFKVGGQELRIPMGFEVAALARASANFIGIGFDKEMTLERAGKNVLKIAGHNLAMNPIPQPVRPMLDAWANSRATGGAIENTGDQRLEPNQRYNARSTLIARGASNALDAVGVGLSPKKIDYLVQAYTAWLGTMSVGLADTVVRSVSDEPERPERDIWAALTNGRVRTDTPAQSRYVDALYEQGEAISQAYATYKELLKRGRPEEAKAHFEDNKDKILKHRTFESVKRIEGDLNEQIRSIENSRTLTGEQKRIRIMQLNAMKSRAAQRVFAPEATP